MESYTAHGVPKPGAYALLTISDTGCGMDETTRKRLFEPFFTTKEVGRGTGLGMAVVYGIIEQHDGAIDVISAPNKGTSFRIYLPLSTETSEEPSQESPSAHRLEGDETVLLVEDDDMVRNLLANLLREFGYKVLEAGDGSEALELFTAAGERIDLVVTDLVMPETGGADLADSIRASRPNLPFVFTTGYAPDTMQQRLASLPQTRLLSKPLAPTTLLGAVRALLDANAG
ncbi:MAG: response regulator [Deltaproteobacteria bacterium]|nr:MAG: response regulator [Deltaproteobacteria bacterium]